MALQRLPIKKGRPFLLILLLAAVVMLMAMLSKCDRNDRNATPPSSEVIKSGGDTLDVAIEISPLAYYVSGDSVAGIDYEIIQSISAMSGRVVKFHIFGLLESALEGLANGKYDIVISSLPATASLKQKFRLSEPVYLDRQVLVQRNDAEPFISKPEQLANDSVWTASGSPFIQRIENLSAEIGEPITVISLQGETSEHLVKLISKGKVPRAVVNAGLARRMKQLYFHNLDFSTPIGFTQFQSWILTSSNPSLADSIDVWLLRFKSTPRYVEILEKYGMQ